MWKYSVFLLVFVFSTVFSADIDTLLEEARTAVQSGNVSLAISRYRQVLDKSPDDGASHYQLAILLMDEQENVMAARQHFERARDLGFQPQNASYRLARIYARTEREDKALTELELLAESGFTRLALLEGEEDFAQFKQHRRFMGVLKTVRAARYPCEADERHRAFDFWIGEWTVTQNGELAGSNSIQAILNHCTLLEQWEGVRGYSGKSFNYYDPGRDRWNQIWIGDGGTFIEFTGEARNGGIFYTAETINPTDGSVTAHTLDFTPMPEGTIRQLWQSSTDGGETWTTVWDGLYTRKQSTAIQKSYTPQRQ